MNRHISIVARARGVPTVWVRRAPIAFAIVAALVHLASLPGLYYPDTTNFLREGWVLGERSPYPVIPPAYPLVLDLIALVFPPPARMFALVVVQQAAVVGCVWCTLRTLELVDRPRLAIGGAWLVALYWPFYGYAQTAQSELLFVFFLLASTLLTVRALMNPTGRVGIAAGALAGLAIAQRTLGIGFVAGIVAALIFGRLDARRSFVLRFGGGLVAVVLAFVANNYAHHRAPRLVGGTGIHLFNRIPIVDQWLPDTPESRRLQEIASRHGVQDIRTLNVAWQLHAILAWQEKLGPKTADGMLRTVALQSWRTDPWRMLKGTAWSMNQMLIPVPPREYVLWEGMRPEGFDAHALMSDDGWKGDTATLNRMRGGFPPYRGPEILGAWVYDVFDGWGVASGYLARGVWVIPILLATFIFGMVRRHATLILFSGAASAQLLAAAIGDAPYERYWDPAVPFYFMAVLIAAAEIVSRSARHSGDT